MRRQITQAELRECLDLETLVNRKMIQIRERVKKGATVEPGALSASHDESEDFDPKCAAYSNMGLNIDDTETIEKFKRWQREHEAKRTRPNNITVIRGASLEVAHA